MFHFSYQIGGVLFAIFLVGAWIATVIALGEVVSRNKADHRAMMSMLNRKMDAILEALAMLQNENRQKPDRNVENLSLPPVEIPIAEENPALDTELSADHDTDALPLLKEDAPPLLKEETDPSKNDFGDNPYYQIMPMVHQGMDISTIAHQLRVSEDEVAMVIRMNRA